MENLSESAISIFIDGSSKQGPRRGGVGYRIVTLDESGGEQTEDFSPNGYPGASNNQMELMACVLALEHVTGKRSPFDFDRFTKIVILTDSLYLHDNLSRAIHQWSRSQWKKISGAPVLNPELWRRLAKLFRSSPRPVHLEWRRGKSSEHTKAVDKLAKDSAERPFSRPLATPALSRKLTDQETDPGSVPVSGEVLEIRIVEAQRLSLQRMWRYRYEVLSGDHEGAADWATSDLVLHRYTRYRARFNDDPANPRIEDVLGKEKLSKPTA